MTTKSFNIIELIFQNMNYLKKKLLFKYVLLVLRGIIYKIILHIIIFLLRCS